MKGNACIGISCTDDDPDPNLPTLILKGPQPHIRFDDQFVEGGSSPHDWALLINPNSAAEFSIADAENGLFPFTIAGGAPDSSVYVASNGKVGLGTATPAAPLHLFGSAANDVHIGIGPNPASGPAFNVGYGGSSFGRGAGFLNVLPDASATAPNPSLRFMTATVERMIVTNTGNVGIGTSSPSTQLHVRNTGSGGKILAENASGTTTPRELLEIRNNGGAAFILADTSTPQRWSIISFGGSLIQDNQANAGLELSLSPTGNLAIAGTLTTGTTTVNGNLTVTGTKNFAVVDPADARQAIYYTALEGPEAGTYFRGTARTTKGEAVIELPDYFARLTEPERLTVQLTPLGTWGQLYVAEKTPSRLVVRVAPGSTDLEFDYFVQGVRKGYLDYQVQRPNTLPK